MATKTYKKVSVVKLSPHFTEATKVVTVPLIPPNDDQILIKNLYAGVNASDVMVSAGRHLDRTIPPFDIGYEVRIKDILCYITVNKILRLSHSHVYYIEYS